VALLRKMTCNLRHPVGLRHPVQGDLLHASVNNYTTLHYSALISKWLHTSAHMNKLIRLLQGSHRHTTSKYCRVFLREIALFFFCCLGENLHLESNRRVERNSIQNGPLGSVIAVPYTGALLPCPFVYNFFFLSPCVFSECVYIYTCVTYVQM